MSPPRYARRARVLHWLVLGLLCCLVPLAMAMTYRGYVLDRWDATTDVLFSLHKGLGFCTLIVVVVRLGNRLVSGAPAAVTMPRWMQRMAAASHAALYALLLIVPLLGWWGVSVFDARLLFGAITLPALGGVDRGIADWVFALHRRAAFVLLAMVALHVAAALQHRFIRRDGVWRRMVG